MTYADRFTQMMDDNPKHMDESWDEYHTRIHELCHKETDKPSPHQKERPKVLQKVKDRYR